MLHRLEIRIAALVGVLLLLTLVAGCGGDDPKPGDDLIDPTGIWSLTLVTNAGSSDCPITVTGFGLTGVYPFPGGISDTADTQFTLSGSKTFIDTVIEDEPGVSCIPFAFGYAPNTATASVQNWLGLSFPLSVAGGIVNCTYTPDHVDVTINFTSTSTCDGTATTTGVLTCTGPLGAKGGNDNCTVVSDIVGTKCSPNCTVDCP